MARVGVLAGSFDPFTNGHQSLVRDALQICDRLIVAIGVHPTKPEWLPLEQRLASIAEANQGLPVTVQAFSGLVVDFAREVGATCLIRGVRDQVDSHYELTMAVANKKLAPQLTTVLLPTDHEVSFISSSLVRELVSHDTDIGAYVPEAVAKAILAWQRGLDDGS